MKTEELETLSPEDNYKSTRKKAMKWIKNERCYDNSGFDWSSGIKGFIKFFFNITKEDLQNG